MRQTTSNNNQIAPSCDPLPLLRHQVALVTGASSGIGQAIAIGMADAGAQCVVNFFGDESGADETRRAIESSVVAHKGKAITIQADVSKEDEVRRLFAAAAEAFGRIDIVVSNAGVQDDAPLVDMSLDQWRKVLDVNLTGQFLCAREAVRHFKSQPARRDLSAAIGKIICISSVHEIIPWASRVNYAASKGGLGMLMRSIAQEVAKDRIRVNSIAPGAIRTSINQEQWDDEESRRELLKLIPYGRIGDPADVARLAVWLASDDADYITGETIVIDGGMTLYPGFRDDG